MLNFRLIFVYFLSHEAAQDYFLMKGFSYSLNTPVDLAKHLHRTSQLHDILSSIKTNVEIEKTGKKYREDWKSTFRSCSEIDVKI